MCHCLLLMVLIIELLQLIQTVNKLPKVRKDACFLSPGIIKTSVQVSEGVFVVCSLLLLLVGWFGLGF